MKLKFLFVLAAILACTWAAEDGANWMKNNYGILGRRTLKQICILGSHDSGMSEYKKGTALAHPCNVLTQSYPIRDQLKFGARYFDIRPVLDNGEFVTGHYSKLPGHNYQGGNGQSIKSIIDEINQFITTHNELVLVRLSKSLNSGKSRSFDSEEWERLFHMLDGTKNLFYTSNGKVYLPGVTLEQFTNKGSKGAVLYIINEAGVSLGSRLGKGYFYYSNLDPYSKYSNTHKLNNMMKDQINKMKDFSRNSYFLLSWTLTQGAKHSGLCRVHMGKSIKELAAEANSKVWEIVQEVNSFAFPNILYVDNIKDSSFVNVVMEINKRLNA
ncbi:uncharacterized protein [Halyomorpha halys]|uniref:uncharacterized protein n=1 Tax=Halyomorpha halys TaxID=286706 RepID=UPI0006D4DF65|nr:uncharacterized protein LOC106678614 [Halyomorpha halys]XP_014272701.1 uncharacterized protein LOC106678614 [Halyomorpha halys]XP_014272702.1 uncharacterized protein LOC106678614 [Halyomorpha halys]